jgi:hypothetical protein
LHPKTDPAQTVDEIKLSGSLDFPHFVVFVAKVQIDTMKFKASDKK